METVFGKIWFQKHQKSLLRMLNAPVIKYWFRWVLGIKTDKKILELQQQSYWMDLGLKWTRQYGIQRHVAMEKSRIENKGV